MLGPFGHDGICLLLHLTQVGPGRLTDGKRGRGLGACCDVHLLWGGQLHGLVLRWLEDTWSSAGEEGAPGPAFRPWELDWAERTGREEGRFYFWVRRGLSMTNVRNETKTHCGNMGFTSQGWQPVCNLTHLSLKCLLRTHWHTWGVFLGCQRTVEVSGFLAQMRTFLWCCPGLKERRMWNPTRAMIKLKSFFFVLWSRDTAHLKYQSVVKTNKLWGNIIREITRKAWLALSLRVESSGLSTGVWLVNFESNWLTSSADCCKDEKGDKHRWGGAATWVDGSTLKWEKIRVKLLERIGLI